jgi:hypothetical protein
VLNLELSFFNYETIISDGVFNGICSNILKHMGHEDYDENAVFHELADELEFKTSWH